MRVCILSMQSVQNFGSLLQSYSLKKMLESLGHEVFFIDIEPNEKDNLLRQENIKDYSFECGKRGLFAKLQRIDKYAYNRLCIRKLSNQQNEAFDNFRNRILKINIKLNDEHYDFCVIGSDEVFNCNTKSKWGFTSQLFGNVRQADRVITYAASCGSTIYGELSEGVKEKIKKTFRRISAFSVRDKNTEEFVYKLAGIEPNINLDPVLVENFEKEIAKSQQLEELPESYCVVYSYYNRIHSKDEIKSIKEFCKKRNMKIVSVGAPQMWITNHLVLEPFQMLRVFQNADFIITDTFHGTIFSAKYAKRFATLIRPSNKNKLSDLIERLEIRKHLIENMSQLDKAYRQEKQQDLIDSICEKERERTLSYLKESLQYE